MFPDLQSKQIYTEPLILYYVYYYIIDYKQCLKEKAAILSQVLLLNIHNIKFLLIFFLTTTTTVYTASTNRFNWFFNLM